jgi:hypothetical protein
LQCWWIMMLLWLDFWIQQVAILLCAEIDLWFLWTPGKWSSLISIWCKWARKPTSHGRWSYIVPWYESHSCLTLSSLSVNF